MPPGRGRRRWRLRFGEANGETIAVPCSLSDAADAGAPAPGAAVPDMSDSYDAYISSGLYDRRYPAPNRRTLRRLLRLMPAGGRFMDFGAGTGRYTSSLLESTGATGVAYDVCPAACRMLAGRLRRFVDDGRLDVRNGGLDEMVAAFRHGFDLVFLAFGVVAHVSGRTQRVSLLGAIREMLGPEGALVLSLPNARRRFHAEQRRAAPLVREGTLEPGDILYERRSRAGTIEMFYHLFSPPEARSELAGAGFQVASMEPESLLPETAVVRNRLLGCLDDLACEAVPAAGGYGFLIVARP